MKANIHIYAVVRIKVPAVGGADDHACIDRALAGVDLDALFDRTGPSELGIEHIEYAEEICGYLVDPLNAAGEPDTDHSRRYRDRSHAAADHQDDAPLHPPARRTDALPAPDRQLVMRYLGCLGLLARCSIALRDAEETTEDLRSDIERALDDAQATGLIRWRRILNRIEIEPA
jgi:hypothetical protein